MTAGSPVLDEAGVLGQVTRVYPAISEVTLVIDHIRPSRCSMSAQGARGVAFGEAVARAGTLELRFMSANADVQAGTSYHQWCGWCLSTGIASCQGGKVERRVDSAFARIYCTPLALVDGANYVMLLKPVAVDSAAARPAPKHSLRCQRRANQNDHAPGASNCCCLPTRYSSGHHC